MDAADHLRHGAARHLAVVAAVRILEHELELVRVLAVSCYVRRGDDVADGRRQFVGAGIMRVHPPVLASDAGEDLVFHGLARGIKPDRRAGPGVDDGVALWAHIEPALDGRRIGSYVKEHGEVPHCLVGRCRCTSDQSVAEGGMIGGLQVVCGNAAVFCGRIDGGS